jgi:imidazolonepropionase-like amidohydrolase
VLAVRAARLFDGRGGAVVSPGVVVVAGGRIQAVGGAIPKGADLLDLGDATILPGLIDAHTHLTGEATDDWKQGVLDSVQKPIPEQALESAVHARKALMAGFTTCRDVGSSDLLDVGLRNAIRSGAAAGPRMLVAVNGIGATGGHCDPTGGFRAGLFGREPGFTLGVADGADAVRAAVRFNVKNGADVIKTCATGGVLSLADDVDTPQLTQAELDALVDEAHALRRRTAAHAHGAEGAKRAIRAGIDSIEHGSFLDDEALDLMRSRGTYLVPTLMAHVGIRERLARAAYLPPSIAEKARAASARVSDTFRRALSRGVKVAFGTDAAVYPHGRNAEEFALMVELGMSPADALRAATSANADLLGIAADLGTIEAGKIADLVAVPGNPLADVRAAEKVFFVMKEGAVVRNDRGSGGPAPAP